MTEKKTFDDLDAVKVLVEALEKFNDGERDRIIRWACEKLGAKNVILNLPEIKGIQRPDTENGVSLQTSRSSTDIKSFVLEKKPVNDAQFVAVISYYYKFEAPDELKKDLIASEDLNEAARLADWTRFTKPAATLNNVYSKSGFLDKADYGKYKLNTVGENLVAMVLPNEDGARSVKKSKNKKKVVKRKKVNKK